MKRTHLRHALCAALLATVAIGAGCEQKQSQPVQPIPPAQVAKPGPEESFSAIVESIRRDLEEIPIRLVIPDRSGGHSMMTGRNDVSHELIPPAKVGDPYRGVITVESESRYSVQRSVETPEKPAGADQESGNQNAISAEDPGVEVYDPALVTAPGAPPQDRPIITGERNGVTVARRADEHKRSYELVYENGSWRLVTKLDLKTEKSIQFAFDRALESQS